MALEIFHTAANTARSSKAVGIIERVFMQQTPAEAPRRRFGATGYEAGGASVKHLITEYSHLYQKTGAAFHGLFFDWSHKRGFAVASIVGEYRAAEDLLSTWENKGTDCPGFATYAFTMGKAWKLQFYGYFSPEAIMSRLEPLHAKSSGNDSVRSGFSAAYASLKRSRETNP
ncbi:hypothetical protein B0T18DRAFT_390106 [Schizothecium vesticola]|uniref:Uncharacterized protein n=1 Tax=Schizothecium vesticola TaxID=314040 RepID=A0AA40EU26_9PEZI|nr:hypothetical protein B0T18DRAFT_390106 [Schizothecium vesticola]